ncbi:MAG: type I-F CRISPR-associated endoribonuclease Cas6/Csy4 [Sterolibacterium sp.]|jgi:CRISPR-associated endonuclease Csy4|nr:type I-F CRISPR-associated endoribonuclease Cas6/Csy4 [Sterolibacterium sp.]
MDHYIDIRLLPDPEFPPNVLLNALYGKLHRGLVAQGGQNIGLSFPDVNNNGLGTRLRLHGTAAELANFMARGWLLGMRDHTIVSPVQPVPTPKGYRVVRRVQVKSSPERLRRRLMARKGISAEEAEQAIPDSAAERLDLPYVVLNSQTTGQQFRLFVEHRPPQEQAASGPFSAYGLSPTATVPWF